MSGIRNDETYNTAIMLKRLKRQVSKLDEGSGGEQITILLKARDKAEATDSVSATVDTSPEFTWSESEWGFAPWQ